MTKIVQNKFIKCDLLYFLLLSNQESYNLHVTTCYLTYSPSYYINVYYDKLDPVSCHENCL